VTTRIESAGPDLGDLQARFRELRRAAFEVQLEAAYSWPCPNPAHSFEGGCYLVDETAPDAGPLAPFNPGQTILVPQVCPRRFEAVGIALASPISLGRTTERSTP
jgi:hypothetical protein